jgi:hypothetical protein
MSPPSSPASAMASAPGLAMATPPTALSAGNSAMADMIYTGVLADVLALRSAGMHPTLHERCCLSLPALFAPCD